MKFFKYGFIGRKLFYIKIVYIYDVIYLQEGLSTTTVSMIISVFCLRGEDWNGTQC